MGKLKAKQLSQKGVRTSLGHLEDARNDREVVAGEGGKRMGSGRTLGALTASVICFVSGMWVQACSLVCLCARVTFQWTSPLSTGLVH